VFVCSLETVQSNVITQRQLDLCGPASTAFIPTDFTASHASTFVETASLIVMPNTTPALPLPYHAVAAPVPPAVADSLLLGYVDLSLVAAQPTSRPPSLIAPQNCLTTKIRAARCLTMAPSKFTPYWVHSFLTRLLAALWLLNFSQYICHSRAYRCIT